MGLYAPYRNFSFVKKSNSMPFRLNIMEIQEWTKSSPYTNVQTHIFEMWRHWMFLDVNKLRTGRVSNTMAFYTVLMWGKRRVKHVYFPLSWRLNLTSEPLFKLLSWRCNVFSLAKGTSSLSVKQHGLINMIKHSMSTVVMSVSVTLYPVGKSIHNTHVHW